MFYSERITLFKQSVFAEVHYFWEDRAQMVRMQAKFVFIVMQEIFQTSWGLSGPSSEVVVHWGYLPISLQMRSSSLRLSLIEVFHRGRLPLRSSSIEVVFHWGCLPLRLSSVEVVFHWGCLPLRGGEWSNFFWWEVVKCFFDLRNCAIRFLLDYKQKNYLSGVGGGWWAVG